MNIFRELEGLSGEQLATAGLRLLLLRSPACREAFVGVLDRLSPHGPLLSSSHFSCYTEYGTTDGEKGRGRLDMTVELDDVVVGLEVKLAAAFQPDQPTKYQAELDRVCKLLGSVRRVSMRNYLVILAPRNRRREIQPHLAGTQKFLAWETVLEALEGADGGDPFVAVLIEDFDRHLREGLEFLPRFRDWAHHLTSHWEPRGTQYQRQLLWKLRPLLPNYGGRLGTGDTWAGYYFQPSEDEGRSWLGFMPGDQLSPPCAGACLLLASPRELSELEHARPVEMAEAEGIWVDGKQIPAWVVQIQPEWDEPQDWSGALRGFV